MRSTGVVERIDVNSESLYYQEHVARYELARGYVTCGPLLDIASGTGYGSQLLQPTCQALVVGMDIDPPSALSARQAYSDPKIQFLIGSGTAIPFRSASFNTITSMETIEHIVNDRAFLSELARVLRPDGCCILSTPNRLYSENHKIANPYHVREYRETELTALLCDYFSSIQVFYQGFDDGYRANVHAYSDSIQAQKRQLHPLLRWGVDHIYRPVKRFIPASFANTFIRKLLGLSYPQPDTNNIKISAEPVQDSSNFVVVCHKLADQSAADDSTLFENRVDEG